jgi:hypothetical protein
MLVGYGAPVRYPRRQSRTLLDGSRSSDGTDEAPNRPPCEDALHALEEAAARVASTPLVMRTMYLSNRPEGCSPSGGLHTGADDDDKGFWLPPGRTHDRRPRIGVLRACDENHASDGRRGGRRQQSGRAPRSAVRWRVRALCGAVRGVTFPPPLCQHAVCRPPHRATGGVRTTSPRQRADCRHRPTAARTQRVPHSPQEAEAATTDSSDVHAATTDCGATRLAVRRGELSAANHQPTRRPL